MEIQWKNKEFPAQVIFFFFTLFRTCGEQEEAVSGPSTFYNVVLVTEAPLNPKAKQGWMHLVRQKMPGSNEVS